MFALIAKQRKVFQRIAIDDYDVGKGVRLQCTYLARHTQDLGPDRTTLEAGLGWAVSFDKGPFLGREALVEQRDGIRGRAGILVEHAPDVQPTPAAVRSGGSAR